ncbi:MAG: hypothetical protein WDN26_15455 [Chitinophagaceae bacterium]
MLSKEQEDEECDATGDDSSNTAGNIKIIKNFPQRHKEHKENFRASVATKINTY